MATKPRAVQMVEAAESTGMKTFESTVEAIKQGATGATTGLEQAQSKMTEGYNRAMKTAEKFASFHQANLEAMMKSSQILATGLTDLTRHVAGTAQANMEETMSNLKALVSVKSLKEAFELQSGFARASLEKAMTESGKLTETSLKLVEEATAPLSARVTATVETFTNRA